MHNIVNASQSMHLFNSVTMHTQRN